MSRFAIEDPQAAYIAYTKGMSSRWTFVQRTVCNTSKLFQPLEDVIRQVLLPAIVGRAISDSERNIIALPMRYGGLGIQNPVEIADREYFTSKKITEKLTDHIYAQHLDLTGLDRKWMGSVKSSMKLAKETFLKNFNPGDVFGELALLYNAPRAASIQAKSESALWVLDRNTFNSIVKEAS